MNNEMEIISQLKVRLEKNATWAKHVEELAATYGKLMPTQIAQLGTEQLWKLWTASKFAETGTPSLPKPTIDQWPGVRKMTKLLCDRAQPLGERFEAAQAVYRETFSARQVQLPVLLRTLLILEGGRFGTVASRSHLNPLLKWAGKPGMDYAKPSSITSSLETVGELIDVWATKVRANSIGERASIAWHICMIIQEHSAQTSLQGHFKSVLTDYLHARNSEPFSGSNPVLQQFEQLKSAIRQDAAIQHRPDLIIKWGAGQGNWARVPWLGLMDRRETTTTQRGVYCVYLFRQDMSGVYLTFNQGVTEVLKQLGRKDGSAELRSRALTIRQMIPELAARGFSLDDDIDLKADSGLGADYETSTIAHKFYPFDAIPSDADLKADLAAVLTAYDTYLGKSVGLEGGSALASHWIFQGNPDQFDVDSYVQGRQEIVWTVRQHKDRILVGDRVLIWRSGAAGGVIAECSITAPPSMEVPDDAPELWKSKAANQIGEMRCKLHVDHSFVNAPIGRTAIKEVLPDLSIIKASQGTNFEITQTDYKKIMDLKESTFVSLPFDSSALSLALLAIEATHMRIEPQFLNRFVTSLVAKPFLILTGNSGTGKTKLAELFVQWLCHNASSQFVVVPVGADWTDNRNVLGFVNYLRTTNVKEAGAEIDVPVYQTTKILDLLLDAHRKENEGKPFFLILDEMNLSHVERYFADFLSTMESKEGRFLLHREGRMLPRMQGGLSDVPESLALPQNLFVIGTVNVDETTYMFSPKVLDRANVIEFRVANDAPVGFLKSGGRSIGEVAHASAGYAEGFLELSLRARSVKGKALALVSDPDVVPADAKEGIENCQATITNLFMLMQKRHQEFAFRTMTEVLRFLAVDYELKPAAEVWNWKSAMDAQILQKVLPKLHGSKRKIGSLLAALAKFCEHGNLATAEVLLMDETKAEAYLAAQDKREISPTFKESYVKLCEMMEAVRRDQFVSFIQ